MFEFSRQLKGHGNNIMRAVTGIIDSLVNNKSADKLVYTLGTRHIEYGAKVEHIHVNLIKILLNLFL